MTSVYFLHGMESGPDGLKIQAMRRVVEARGLRSEAPDFRFSRDPAERTRYLLTLLPRDEPVLLVGSSLGGFVAAATAAAAAALPDGPRIAGLFLLCPAFDLPGYPLDRPAQPLRGAAVQLVHGRHDSVVPLATSLRAGVDWQAGVLVTEDEHPLHDSVAAICVLLDDFVRRLSR